MERYFNTAGPNRAEASVSAKALRKSEAKLYGKECSSRE